MIFARAVGLCGAIPMPRRMAMQSARRRFASRTHRVPTVPATIAAPAYSGALPPEVRLRSTWNILEEATILEAVSLPRGAERGEIGVQRGDHELHGLLGHLTDQTIQPLVV